MTLGEQDVVALVEDGAQLIPLDRAVQLYARATDTPLAEAADETIAHRDIALFKLHVQMFGQHAAFVEPCAQCGANLEGALDLAQVIAAANAAPVDGTIRSPTSREIAHLMAGAEARVILGACLGRMVDDVEAAQAEIEAAFPHINVKLALACNECGEQQQVRFDIARSMWPALEAIAMRWFDDVHRLACAYGWSEREIAALPSDRRARYLQRIALSDRSRSGAEAPDVERQP